jgi:FMN phosphatase YigB (HAD superfamily)
VSERAEVIFFDLGDTLGSAVLSSSPIHLVAFDVYPFVSQLLSDLQHQGIRLGIISNTGDDGRETVDAVLRAAGIVDYFEPGLRLYSHDIGLTKDSPRIFTKAAELAGLPAHRNAACSWERTAPSAHSHSPPACARARTLF